MLENLKILLGIAADDTSLDVKLSLLLDMASARLRILLGGIDAPDTLEHIVVEVAVKRFNRIGSEGFTSHSVEGESISVSEDDFSEYSAEIEGYLDTIGQSRPGGVIRFL